MPNPFILIGVLIAMFLLGVSTWLTLGWLADKYDAYRTDNWKGW